MWIPVGRKAGHDAKESPTEPGGVSPAQGRAGAGRAEELAERFEPTAQAIRTGVPQADRDDGRPRIRSAWQGRVGASLAGIAARSLADLAERTVHVAEGLDARQRGQARKTLPPFPLVVTDRGPP